jgi:3-phenylpropionate/trans-cinnamate dioxygenase ferredoxin reductase subunit
VQRFEGGGGRVEAAVTDHGARVEGDLMVVGVGIEPNVDLVEGTGIAVENGVVVDERLRATAGVFAAGDVANHLHPVFRRRVRVEHFDNALKQGAAAARNMLGQEVVFDDPHWFWSDQFEHNLQYVGFAETWDEFVVRGSLEERTFVGFYLRAGVVLAVVGVGRGRDVRRATGLVKAGRPVDPEALRDEDVDLKTLSRSLTSPD